MIDWSYVFLGFLQGVTEFLPISSSGHLFLMEHILKTDRADLSLILILHTATFFSVCAVFYKDIKSFVFSLQKKKNLQLLLKVLVSLVPLLLVGLFFRSFVQQSFEKNTVALGFLSSGLLLLSLFFIRKKNLSLEEMSFFQAFLIGLAQSIAVLPGFSRSGWTISIGLYCGLSPRTAVYFSFLISLPAIAGSALVDLVFHLSKQPLVDNLNIGFGSSLSLLLSFLIAFSIGFLSLLLVLKMVQYKKLHLFSFYLLPLSLLVLFGS